jgi:hypothetical protein
MKEKDHKLPDSAIDPNIDPDPFSIAFAILGLIFAGGSYLEIRRQSDFLERQAKEAYRKAWFHAKRTLIHARRVIDEFATYATEDEFINKEFLFGKVKLTMDTDRAQELRRLHGNTLITATHMADSLDDISAYLGSQYSLEVEKIQEKLKEQGLPHSYDAVIILAKDALELYETLVDEIGKAEGFILSTT